MHHIAWNSADKDHEAWRERVAQSGAHPTQVIDRHYFKSIYFREPSGVLFELATPSPGFTIDEPLRHSARSSRSHRGSRSCASRSGDRAAAR